MGRCQDQWHLPCRAALFPGLRAKRLFHLEGFKGLKLTRALC